MSLRRLSRNVLLSSSTIIVSALLLFELYRFLARVIGVEQIGVWSIVLASAGIIRLAEVGMTGSVVKFVATDLGAGQPERAASRIMMALTVVGVSVGIAALVMYPLVRWLIAQTVQDEILFATATGLLPWAIAAAWVVSIVTVLASALDGAQRTDLRAFSIVSGSAMQVALVYGFIPTYGLAALGPVQLAFVSLQALLLLTGLIKVARDEHWGWPVWRWPALRELFRYGSSFQLTAIGQLLFEPTVRWMLGAFGSLALAGYYEMANRALIQLRQVIVAAYQMLVPYLASRFSATAANEQQTRSYYEITMRVMMLTALPYFAMVGAALPFVLTFWAGHYADQFLMVGLVCLLGRFVSTSAVPAFMLYLSIGRLRWVVVNELTIGCLNVVLGMAGGLLFGGPGVVLGAMLALSFGTLVVVVQFHREYRVLLANAMPRGLLALVLVSLCGVAGSFYYAMKWQGIGMPGIGALVGYLTLGALLFAIMWQDPLRHMLLTRLRPPTGSPAP